MKSKNNPVDHVESFLVESRITMVGTLWDKSRGLDVWGVPIVTKKGIVVE